MGREVAFRLAIFLRCTISLVGVFAITIADGVSIIGDHSFIGRLVVRCEGGASFGHLLSFCYRGYFLPYAVSSSIESEINEYILR